MTDSHAELASFLEGLPEPHILCSSDYRIVAANAAYRQQFGHVAPLEGRTCYEVSHHYSAPCDQCGESCPKTLAAQSGQRERVLHLHHTPTGQSYVNIEITPLFDAAGQLTGYIERMDEVEHAHHKAQPQGLIGRSAPFRDMLALVMRVAASPANVMLLGETGTGKEIVAQTLHATSPRANQPFVPVDCSSLTESLFESELFGHERGAFTDAHRSKAGLVEAAHGGTLFLDEIGDIPLQMQVKLLRLLETGSYRRVGSTEQRLADVRIISATHRDLPRMVREGSFRQDLYHRLSTFPIRIPPLRARRDDIPLLVEALLQRLAPQRQVKLTAAALARLEAHPFGGNIRELRNLLERMLLLRDGHRIDAGSVQAAIDMDAEPAPTVPPPMSTLAAAWPSSPGTATGIAMPNASPYALRPGKAHLLDAIRERAPNYPGSRAELAAELGISERTLYRKLKALGLA